MIKKPSPPRVYFAPLLSETIFGCAASAAKAPSRPTRPTSLVSTSLEAAHCERWEEGRFAESPNFLHVFSTAITANDRIPTLPDKSTPLGRVSGRTPLPSMSTMYKGWQKGQRLTIEANGRWSFANRLWPTMIQPIISLSTRCRRTSRPSTPNSSHARQPGCDTSMRPAAGQAAGCVLFHRAQRQSATGSRTATFGRRLTRRATWLWASTTHNDRFAFGLNTTAQQTQHYFALPQWLLKSGQSAERSSQRRSISSFIPPTMNERDRLAWRQ